MTIVTAIALSGGIDSLVSAALLKEQGHRVMGIHFLNGYEARDSRALDEAFDPESAAFRAYAQRTVEPLADQLDIPIHIVDLKDQFQRKVVNYFVQAYASGKTPNPCLVCNPSIKFDILFQHARSLGAQRLATGHYARIKPRDDGRLNLLRGVDSHKDQSYFLARLTQVQLSRAVLPLGDHTKAQTRNLARDLGLVPTSSGESQDVCFIKNGRYGNFIVRQPGFTATPGPIEDIHGCRIGQHLGLHRFTVGQRRGINCPAAAPYYVVRLEPERNCLVVGGKQDLLSPDCQVEGIHWIAHPPREPIRVQTRVRYRHRAVPSLLSPVGHGVADIQFDTPQSAVTPGQGAVFYDGDVVLGAGWIR
jgi:tRNA-specific 2-thiouridylase